MAEHDKREIAAAWLEVQRNWWAWEALKALCREQPAEAWHLVVRMIDMTNDSELLEDIGAGPLEDLLQMHADLLYPDVLAQATESSRMRTALSHVWLTDRASPTARKLLELGCQFVRVSPDADA